MKTKNRGPPYILYIVYSRACARLFKIDLVGEFWRSVMLYQQKQSQNFLNVKNVNNGGVAMNRLEQYVHGKISSVNPHVSHVIINSSKYSFDIRKTIDKCTYGVVYNEYKKSSISRSGKIVNICVKERELDEFEIESLISELLEKDLETISKIYNSIQKVEEHVEPIILPPISCSEEEMSIEQIVNLKENAEPSYNTHEIVYKGEDQTNPILVPVNYDEVEYEGGEETNNLHIKPQICWTLFISFVLSLFFVLLSHKIHTIFETLKQLQGLEKEEILLFLAALVTLCQMWIIDKTKKVKLSLLHKIEKFVSKRLEVVFNLIKSVKHLFYRMDKYSVVINIWFRFTCLNLVKNYQKLMEELGNLYSSTMIKMGIPKQIVIRVW